MINPDTESPSKTTVAIAGLGAIGGQLARELIGGGLPGYHLAAVSARNLEKARAIVGDVPIIPVAELVRHADVVVECTPSKVFYDVANPVIEAGKTLVVMTGSALLERQSLINRARETGAKILVPSGAMPGIDALNAAAEGVIHSVVISTRKPPDGLRHAPYVVENSIDVSNLEQPLLIFKGSVREAARHFPANVNVAAALSLAGIGADRTTLEVWADPSLTRNTHRVSVTSDSSNFSIEIQNTPSEVNPATGRITPQSVIALLRGLQASLKIGT